jgi:hypothetical protein
VLYCLGARGSTWLRIEKGLTSIEVLANFPWQSLQIFVSQLARQGEAVTVEPGGGCSTGT